MGKCLSIAFRIRTITPAKEESPSPAVHPLQLTTPTNASISNGDDATEGANNYVTDPSDHRTTHIKQMHLQQQQMAHREATKKRNIVVALYGNWGNSEMELTFEKGARFEVIEQTNIDWWYARNLSTNEHGYITVNKVVDATALEAHDWYFGLISRKEAEKYLTGDPSNVTGTYLVRASASRSTHGYSLSIKGPGVSGDVVRHHRILKDAIGNVYIISGITFRTMQDLINYYCLRRSATMPPLLSKPCPKPVPTQWDLSVQTRDHWEIDRNTLQTTRKLGTGNFGEVWHGLWNNTRDVAIKTLKHGTMSVEAFLEEASIMKKLRHQNILVLYAVCTQELPILIVTEYMNNGALIDVLRKQGHTIDLSELITICEQVASGMAYLEGLGFIHRDLAARNVLMDANKLCKVADFGLARVVDGGEYSPETSKNFPVKWTAPEAIFYNTYTIKSDVWSFGILMIEVITKGANPYPGMNNQEVIDKVRCGYRISRPLDPVECPDYVYNEIVMKCWNKFADDRPTFETLSALLSEYVVANDDVGYDELGEE